MTRRITRTDRPVSREGNRYCGPLVLAALGIGGNTAEAAAAVRRATDKDGAVKGMYNSEMLTTLSAHGFKATPVNVPHVYQARRAPGERIENCMQWTSDGRAFVRYEFDEQGRRITIHTARHDLCDDTTPSCFTPVKAYGITFAAWLRQRPSKSAVYLVNVTNHYVLVSGRKFIDTFTRGEWVNIGDAPHRRKRVEKVWMLTRDEGRCLAPASVRLAGTGMDHAGKRRVTDYIVSRRAPRSDARYASCGPVLSRSWREGKRRPGSSRLWCVAQR